MSEIGFKKQFATDINGVSTEFVFHVFDNKWLLLITQFGKVPPLYNVKFDVGRDERVIPMLHGPVHSPELHVSVPVTMNCCLGADSDEIRGAIQFLVNQTTLNKCSTELLMGLGLQQLDSPGLREIAKVVDQGVF